MPGKFQLKKAANDQFHFSLLAGNGQTILQSQMYKAKTSALGGIESVKENAPQDARYERKTSNDGKPYFVLKAANGQIIGQSQMYSGDAAMNNGIESVKNNAPGAAVDDLSA